MHLYALSAQVGLGKGQHPNTDFGGPAEESPGRQEPVSGTAHPDGDNPPPSTPSSGGCRRGGITQGGDPQRPAGPAGPVPTQAAGPCPARGLGERPQEPCGQGGGGGGSVPTGAERGGGGNQGLALQGLPGPRGAFWKGLGLSVATATAPRSSPPASRAPPRPIREGSGWAARCDWRKGEASAARASAPSPSGSGKRRREGAEAAEAAAAGSGSGWG